MKKCLLCVKYIIPLNDCQLQWQMRMFEGLAFDYKNKWVENYDSENDCLDFQTSDEMTRKESVRREGVMLTRRIPVQIS